MDKGEGREARKKIRKKERPLGGKDMFYFKTEQALVQQDGILDQEYHFPLKMPSAQF